MMETLENLKENFNKRFFFFMDMGLAGLGWLTAFLGMWASFGSGSGIGPVRDVMAIMAGWMLILVTIMLVDAIWLMSD